MSIDQDQPTQAVARVFADLGAGFTGPVVVLGDRLGLWAAMAGAGPLTAAQLALRTGTVERYVHEWLCAVAVAGYIDYDPATRTFALTDEMASVFADEASPTSLIGVFPALIACWADLDAVEGFFRNGGGMGWGDHDPALNRAQARFTRSMYGAGLTTWIGALDGVAATLGRGGRIVDIGCGYGVASLLMAQAFPASTVLGVDHDPASITTARKAAAEAGLGDRVSFLTADATDFPGDDFDLVVFTDCLHDLGDPVAAARHARTTLAPGGTVLVVEPLAADRLEDDFSNPYARIGYSVSTLVCTPSSLAQPGARALGTMAGERRLRQVLAEAGYGRVRRVARDEAPLNIILDARP